MVELREITRSNFENVLELKIAEFQESFVSLVVYSLA